MSGASVCRNRTSVPPGRHFPLHQPGDLNGIHASGIPIFCFFFFYLLHSAVRAPRAPPSSISISANSGDARASSHVRHHLTVKPVRSCPAVGSSADRHYHPIARQCLKIRKPGVHQMFRNITAHEPISLSIDNDTMGQVYTNKLNFVNKKCNRVQGNRRGIVGD